MECRREDLSSWSKKGNNWWREGSREDDACLGRKAIMVTLWVHVSPVPVLRMAPWWESVSPWASLSLTVTWADWCILSCCTEEFMRSWMWKMHATCLETYEIHSYEYNSMFTMPLPQIQCFQWLEIGKWLCASMIDQMMTPLPNILVLIPRACEMRHGRWD